jgi:REP element-mobilizing transposase RayT
MSDPSEVYYIVLRGSGWQPIFKDDEDLRRFARGVCECAAACRVTVHAYCWLATEARLAVQVAAGMPISQFAQCMASWHAREVERDAALTGSHFEQKYRGVRVDGHTALVDLVRHIHLAPLKAGLTDDLLEYAWSSHRAYLGLQACPWLTTEATLRELARAFGGDAQRGYREFMLRGVEQLDAWAPNENSARAGADTAALRVK